MNKTLAASMLLISCAVNAGGMGPIATSGLQFFVSGEGGYTWNQLEGFSFLADNIGIISSKKNDQGGTARIAVGVMHPVMNDVFSMSAEIGWGYYGRTRFTPDLQPALGISSTALNNIFNANVYLNGFDVLAGVTYNFYPRFDLFLKAGALIENARTTLNANAASLGFTDEASLSTNQTQALPEIKLGGSYHIRDNLSIFAAWTHAFGDTSNVFSSLSSTPIPLLTSGATRSNYRNPTLDVATAGLQYNFS